MPLLLRFLWRPGGVILHTMWWSRCFATATLAATLACGSSVVARPPQARSVVAVPAPSPQPLPVAQVGSSPSAAALADARHLLNRFAFGPRPGQVERVARLGPERWLMEQLAGPEESPLLEAAMVPHRAAFVPPTELLADWLGDGWQNETRNLRDLREDAGPHFKTHIRRLATAELTRDILTSRQLEAVMTDFWANHFNVYAAKGIVRVFAGDYLERAIRPHALGRFSELLLATARHPAMLLYLDNAGSRRESAGKQRRGLNENYARELLELHTLGVDGGYTQQDVKSVARILTGWTVTPMKEDSFEFVYRPDMHDARTKTVLGEVFAKGGQEDEGVRLLEFLARHPATAKHLARRLCSRFVADDAPASCVSAAEQAYRLSDGDLKRVVLAIVKDESFWSAATRGSKLKTPLEFVASAARALDACPDGGLELSLSLERLGEPLLQERVPTGYPDSAPEWASAGGMLARMTFASRLGAGNVEGLRVPWEETLPLEPGDVGFVERVGERLLGAERESRTVRVVREELKGVADPAQLRAAAVALFLGSPEFQRQ